MRVTPTEIDQVLTRLAEVPPHLASLAQGLSPDRLDARPDPESWSINEILAHLRACADVWGKSIQVMIAQEHPTLRYVSPRTWMRKKNYHELDFSVSLDAYTRQRNELLQALKALEPAGWVRGATFTGTVKGREQIVFSYAERIADHESEHRAQIEALLQHS